jgi:hypothetical protein
VGLVAEDVLGAEASGVAEPMEAVRTVAHAAVARAADGKVIRTVAARNILAEAVRPLLPAAVHGCRGSNAG